MPGTSITYSDIQVVIGSLNALPQYVASDVRDSLAPVIDDLKMHLAIYPATRPGQRYVRTGTLGRGWTEARPQFIIRAGGAIDMRLENKVDYAGWVMGEEQTWPFVGRWTKAAQVLTEFEDDITRAVEDGVLHAARRAKLL